MEKKILNFAKRGNLFNFIKYDKVIKDKISADDYYNLLSDCLYIVLEKNNTEIIKYILYKDILLSLEKYIPSILKSFHSKNILKTFLHCCHDSGNLYFNANEYEIFKSLFNDENNNDLIKMILKWSNLYEHRTFFENLLAVASEKAKSTKNDEIIEYIKKSKYDYDWMKKVSKLEGFIYRDQVSELSDEISILMKKKKLQKYLSNIFYELFVLTIRENKYDIAKLLVKYKDSSDEQIVYINEINLIQLIEYSQLRININFFKLLIAYETDIDIYIDDYIIVQKIANYRESKLAIEMITIFMKYVKSILSVQNYKKYISEVVDITRPNNKIEKNLIHNYLSKL